MGVLLGFSYQQIAIAAAIFVASTLATTLIVGALLITVPADHFTSTEPISRKFSSPLRRTLYKVGKNVLGLVLVLVGIPLALPAVPGQGLLTIVVGLLLLDIPGKRRLELALLRQDAVRDPIDKLRERFGKPPLLLEPPHSGPSHPEPTRDVVE